MPLPPPPIRSAHYCQTTVSEAPLRSRHLLAQGPLRFFTVTGSSADTCHCLTPLTMRCLQFTSKATCSRQSGSVTDLSLYVTLSLETLSDAFSKPDFPPGIPFPSDFAPCSVMVSHSVSVPSYRCTVQLKHRPGVSRPWWPSWLCHLTVLQPWS